MNVQAFLANIWPTAFFAFIGTFASTFVVGGLVYYAGQMGLCYPLGMCAVPAPLPAAPNSPCSRVIGPVAH